MRILFLIYHGLSEVSGISKKISYQVNGLKELGHEVYLCTYTLDEYGYKIRKIDDITIENLGNNIIASIKSRISFKSIFKFIVDYNIQFIYTRYFHNANPFLIHFYKEIKKRKIKSVIEIPTFPYDNEYKQSGFRLKLELEIDKTFRNCLFQQVDAIVTFTDRDKIFGKNTIKISNGIDFNSIPIIKQTKMDTKIFNIIGVAEVHFWHGYDRIITGIGEYYKNNSNSNTNIIFHIVGGVGNNEMYGSKEFPGFLSIINSYQINEHIIFHNQKFGQELDSLFNISDFAIGSLGRHRCGITDIKTLKNREYAARGIPFIYSEIDNDFENMPYILKAPADNSPINIQSILDFKRNLHYSPIKIRESIKSLSWKNQMEKVIEQISLL